jgi:predicted ATPase
VAQIGAALGRSFSHELISAVAQMPKQQIDDALDQLVNAELIFRRGTPPDAEYTFKHALVRDAAYGTLLRSRRQQIHGWIVTTLESQFPEVVTAQPALIAQHCTEAGFTVKAVEYWLASGRQAIVRSAMVEAAAQLRNGLDLLTSMPEGPWRQQRELEFQMTLGPALIATKGYAAPDVGVTYERARTLAEQLNLTEHLVALLYGQWVYRLVRSEHTLALPYAEELERLGETRNDAVAQLLGRHVGAMTRLYLGQFNSARAIFERCHEMSEPAARSAHLALTESDQYISMLGYLALTLAPLGYLDQAQSLMDRALAESRQLRHAFTLAWTLNVAGWLAIWLRVPLPQAKFLHDETIAISRENNFPFHLSLGTAHCGRALIALGKPDEGFKLWNEGFETYRATGAGLLTPSLLTLLADVCAPCGRIAEGLGFLDKAESLMETVEDRFEEPELHRVRGELLYAKGDAIAAQESLLRALSIARQQSAKFWELRAATSLARLWHDQGKRHEAHDLLAPIYAWFTEGFDTPVLKEAKTLLDELAP